jgi:uncharacterized Zn-binding protein involved in type VI secretion
MPLGILVARVGDIASCQHIVDIGSFDVLVNSLPCAREFKDTAGGGLIVGTNFTVLVNNYPIASQFDFIAPHLPPVPPHIPPFSFLVTGSLNVLTNMPS